MPENIISKIMDPIKKNKIKPKPKYIFILSTIVVLTGIVFAFGLSSFFINALFYSYGGYRMYFPELNHFPWPVVGIIFFTFVFGIWLFKKFDISYTKSFLLSLIIILISLVTLGFFISKTTINSKLLEYKSFKKLYMQALQEYDWVQGSVVEINSNNYLIRDLEQNLIYVFFDSSTPKPIREFSIDDCIRAAGILKDTNIYAKGISRCGKNTYIPYSHTNL